MNYALLALPADEAFTETFWKDNIFPLVKDFRFLHLVTLPNSLSFILVPFIFIMYSSRHCFFTSASKYHRIKVEFFISLEIFSFFHHYEFKADENKTMSDQRRRSVYSKLCQEFTWLTYCHSSARWVIRINRRQQKLIPPANVFFFFFFQFIRVLCFFGFLWNIFSCLFLMKPLIKGCVITTQSEGIRETLIKSFERKLVDWQISAYPVMASAYFTSVIMVILIKLLG